MNDENILDSKELTEDEYGSGNELPATGFLVFGILTLWIYNVLEYHRVLSNHLNSRRSHFLSVVDMKDIPDEKQKFIQVLTERGFKSKQSLKYIISGIYFLSMLLVIGHEFNEHYFGLSFIKIPANTFEGTIKINLIVYGVGSILFYFATILFLVGVFKAIKDHEYYEILFAKMSQDCINFKIIQPSRNFVDRWNKKQSQMALFLLFSIPVIFSPFIAWTYIFENFSELSNIELDQLETMFDITTVVIFFLAAIFHLWGTKILLDIFNSHLRIEAVNINYLNKSSRWLSEKSNPMIDEPSSTIENNNITLPGRALAAIMITDIVGFSKQMEQNETKMFSNLLLHNETIRRVLAENGGIEIKTIGDAFLVRFNSAVNAVKSAIQIQSQFLKDNKSRDDAERLLIRIGIHIGDVLIMENDIMGNGVNVAARIEPLAEPGGICISADVYNLVKKSIDFKVVNIGKRELKNIKDSPEIFKILLDANS